MIQHLNDADYRRSRGQIFRRNRLRMESQQNFAVTKMVVDIVVHQIIKVNTTKTYRHKIWIGKSKDWLLDR